MKKIRAFTIAEIAFVFTFVGVISIIALHTVNNRFTDYGSRYVTAYNALAKAVYNIYAGTYEDKDKCADTFMKDDKELRRCLGAYLNIANKDDVKNQAKKNLISENANDNEFNDKSIQLKLTNGFRYYFSKQKTLKMKYADGTSEEIKYYIVYIDLNGAAKPNRANSHPEFYADSNKKPSPSTPRPDIVPFIITDKGDTLPVGFPIYDRSYLMARVVNEGHYQSKSYTLDEARQYAFGKGDNSVYPDIPLTMIPKFTENIPRGIKLSKKDKVPSVEILERDGDNPAGAYFDGHYYKCSMGTYNCNIKIDDNVGRRF